MKSSPSWRRTQILMMGTSLWVRSFEMIAAMSLNNLQRIKTLSRLHNKVCGMNRSLQSRRFLTKTRKYIDRENSEVH